MFFESAAVLYNSKCIWQQHHQQHIKKTLANKDREREIKKDIDHKTNCSNTNIVNGGIVTDTASEIA